MINDIWSCNPADIPTWTEEDKKRLHSVLREVFNWKHPHRYMTNEELKEYELKYRHTYFRHQDGGIYVFNSIGRNTDDPEQIFVVYSHLWPFESTTWIRPAAEWTSPRFTQISFNEAHDAFREDRAAAQARIIANKAARRAAKENPNGIPSV